MPSSKQLVVAALVISALSRLPGQPQQGDSLRGRPKIVLIHGRAQEYRVAAQLKSEWVGALRDGLAKLDVDAALNAEDIELVSYQDVFEPEMPTPSQCDASELTPDEYVRNNTSSSISQFLSPRYRRAVLPIRDGLAATSKSPRVVSGAMKDVELYFEIGGGIACAVNRRLDDALRAAAAAGRPVVLVAHSLGSLVTYRVLTAAAMRADTLRIARLVTIGSPLPYRKLFKYFLPDSSQPSFPPGVLSWVNVIGFGDLVAFDARSRGLRNEPRLTEVHIATNPADPHSAAAYLKSPITALAIARGWCGAFEVAAPPECGTLRYVLTSDVRDELTPERFERDRLVDFKLDGTILNGWGLSAKVPGFAMVPFVPRTIGWHQSRDANDFHTFFFRSSQTVGGQTVTKTWEGGYAFSGVHRTLFGFYERPLRDWLTPFVRIGAGYRAVLIKDTATENLVLRYLARRRFPPLDSQTVTLPDTLPPLMRGLRRERIGEVGFGIKISPTKEICARCAVLLPTLSFEWRSYVALKRRAAVADSLSLSPSPRENVFHAMAEVNLSNYGALIWRQIRPAPKNPGACPASSKKAGDCITAVRFSRTVRRDVRAIALNGRRSEGSGEETGLRDAISDFNRRFDPNKSPIDVWEDIGTSDPQRALATASGLRPDLLIMSLAVAERLGVFASARRQTAATREIAAIVIVNGSGDELTRCERLRVTECRPGTIDGSGRVSALYAYATHVRSTMN